MIQIKVMKQIRDNLHTDLRKTLVMPLRVQIRRKVLDNEVHECMDQAAGITGQLFDLGLQWNR